MCIKYISITEEYKMNVLSKSLMVGLVSGGLMLSGSALASKSMRLGVQELPSASDSRYITKDHEIYQKLSSKNYIIKGGKVFLKTGKVITIHNAGGKPKKVMLNVAGTVWHAYLHHETGQ
jgi:hypothetical protein